MEFDKNISDFRFERKPEAVPYKNRISYKILFICQLIKYCSANSGCSLEKMQIISSYYFSEEDQKKFIYLLNNDKKSIIFKEDLFLVRAVKYMFSERLLQLQKDGKYRLTDKGKKLNELVEKEEALVKERVFLKAIGKKFPESEIEKMKNRLI